MAEKIVSNEKKPVLANAEAYHAFIKLLQGRFTATLTGGDKLFRTEAEDAWKVYLDHVPATDRQENDCHTCRHFFERFAGLVTISEEGVTSSPFWTTEGAPDDLKPAIKAVKRYVEDAKVTSTFVSDTANLGQLSVGGYPHYSLVLPKKYVSTSKIKEPSQLEAEALQNFQTLRRALSEFTEPQLNEALRILKADAVTRSEKFVAHVEWLLERKQDVSSKKPRNNSDALLWRAVASAPAGWCSPRSSMIGTLLEDLISGMEFSSVQARWNAKMHPLQYQRPQALPSGGAVKQAEILFEKLNLASALERRFARIDEIQTVWKPSEDETSQAQGKGGLFGDLKTKNSSTKPTIKPALLPAQTMTWAKFQRTVLDTAHSIQLKAPYSGHYRAMVTAQNADSEPLLQWDRAEARNQFSTYLYHNGSSASRWGISSGWVEVTAITRDPSHWSAPSTEDKRMMFVIEGAKDSGYAGESTGAGCALFPESIRSGLHGVRSVIEEYSRTHGIAGYESASASGIWFSQGNPVELKVIDAKGQEALYTLDRMD